MGTRTADGGAMRSLFAFAAASFFVAACASEDGPDGYVCPPGWSSDAHSDGGCRASEEVVTQSRASLTTGITGFVRLTTGTCDLCEHCTCNTRLVEKHEVQAFVAGDVDRDGAAFCSRAGLPPLPLARTTTDADGLYSFKLAAGSYVVVSDDPALEESSRCPAVRSIAVDSDVVIAPLVFDHGIY